MENFDVNKMFDKTLRKNLLENPQKCLQEIMGDAYDDSMEYSVHESTKDTIYVVMPDSNSLANVDLEALNAAGTSSCAGTAGTGSTIGSVCGSASTASSVATLGSIGCAT